jgi:hypothetical protein
MFKVETHRGGEPSVVPCESITDTSAGVLDSTQSLEWTDPALPPEAVSALPGKMESEHFRAVERSVFGLIRCSARPDGVDCSLFGLIPVLRFSQPVTSADSEHVSRTWGIDGGLQARREAVLGSLTLEWRCLAGENGVYLHSVSAQVAGFPSRFLPAVASHKPGAIRRFIGAEYARYHGVVTCRYLRRLSRWIHAQAAGEHTA